MHRLVLLLALLAVCASPVVAGAFATRHVVVVVIDGGRFSETLGDPNFTWEPHQGFDLLPQGCTCPFWNFGVTTTLAGHAAIFTGSWQPILDDGTEHPHLPTMFECYRAQTGAPASKVWFVSDKIKLATDAVSDFPGYDSLGASCNTAYYPDQPVMAFAEDRLFADKPAILAMNLGFPDMIAHSGDWFAYLAALHTADSLVFDLWTKIQADSELAGHTTLFVTNDHGRHDDQHGGFQNHGDACYGCQRIQMLALGPDFLVGANVGQAYTQIDIAPTIAMLLGFDMPYATGHPMQGFIQPVGEAGVGHTPAPKRFAFAAPSPNPSAGTVRMALDVPVAGELAVDVLDAQGRRVATLERGAAAPGQRTIAWSGRLTAGGRAAPGAYFVRARLGGRMASARVVLR